VKESGIHQLYLVANSLQCVKASGDRGKDKPTSTSTSTSSADGTDPLQSEPAVDIGIGRPSLVSFTRSELDLVRSIALSEGAGGPLGLLVASLCPTIFGHELVKLGLLLGMMQCYTLLCLHAVYIVCY
jgi:DNA replicative helicase MCM subunit Mcm2 (Cdc46/Mcm family)